MMSLITCVRPSLRHAGVLPPEGCNGVCACIRHGVIPGRAVEDGEGKGNQNAL
jgi:hypothetical protein